MNAQTVRLQDEHLTFILTLVRNASTPLTTHELVVALRERVSRG